MARQGHFESVVKFIAEESEKADFLHHLKVKYKGFMTVRSPTTVDQFIKFMNKHSDHSFVQTLECASITC